MEPVCTALYAQLQDTFSTIEETISGLDADALNWPPGPDMNSLAVLATHVAGATRYWVGEVAGGESAGRNRAAEFETSAADGAELRSLLATTLAHTEGVLSRLSAEDLARTVMARGESHTVAAALLRALGHAAEHKGHMQMIRQLWEQRAAAASL